MLFAAMILLLAASASARAADQRVVAEHLMKDMADSSWIRQGSGKRIVYMFFDPNCPYCHNVYDNLQPIINDRPDLQFRWVPLGMLTDSSKGKAAAIIQAKDPLKAFHHSENNYGLLNIDNGGGIMPAKHVTQKTETILLQNLSILQGNNLYGIPIVVFQADDGKPFYFSGGHSTKQLRAILAHVAKGEYGGGAALN